MNNPNKFYILFAFIIGLNLFVSAAYWPQWRGPAGNGSSAETNLPDKLDTSAILWKSSLPGPGGGTPVIWDKVLFLTAADKSAKQVMAMVFDTDSGKLLWKAPLASDRGTAGGNDMSAPSPVTDGKSVWFLSGNGRLAAFTTAGKSLWTRDLAHDYGEFAVFFGYSSSPLLYDGKLYVLVLQNDKPGSYNLNRNRKELLESYLLALDPATGKTLWRHVRDTDAESQSRETYVTPYPFEYDGRSELIIAGGECVTGHNPATGAELWRWWFTPGDRQTLQHNVPTPVAVDDLLFIIRPEHRPLFALRTDGKGSLDDKAIVWTFQENRCWIATPLVYQNRLYILQEMERELLCFEPQTGRMIWRHELPGTGGFQASPTGADGKIFCISMDGEVITLAAGDEYKELDLFDLKEKQCRATIAVASEKLYIRTGSTLYCFGKRLTSAKPK